MKVLHVINQLSFGGAETSLRQILTSMADAGVEHELLSLSHDDNDFTTLVQHGIPCGRPTRALTGRLDAVSFVRHAIEARRPDLLHTTLFEADLAGRVAAKTGGIPALTSLVSDQYSVQAAAATPHAWKLRAVRHIDGLLARHATTHFHAISRAVADEAARNLGIDRDRIHVIPRGRSRASLGGPPSPARRMRVRSHLGLTGSEVILHVGRQDPPKGHIDLISAFELVAAERPHAVLVCAGPEGNSTSGIRDALRKTPMAERIHFLGHRKDIGDLLSAADVFVFPSRWEGLGGAVIEAMAMHVPVVASDIPALREVLDDGNCGRLITPGDHIGLAEAMGQLLDAPADAADLADQAASRFEDMYTLRACAAQMSAMYREIAAQLNSG